MTGAIIVNKAPGWTSHDVVAKVRRLAGIKKVGHLGTLDPAATGVLPLVVGRATRLAQFYTASDKVYDAVIHFGWATDSYDAEGEVTSEKQEPEALDPGRLAPLLERLRGKIQQVPPPISAKKIGGTPAYKLARSKKPVKLEPVEVTIHSIEQLSCEGPRLRLRVHCSAGTYLRSTAHDLGQAYGCGAFLETLVRLESGEFKLSDARTIEELEAMAGDGTIDQAVLPAARLLPDIPSQTVDHLTATQIRQGRDFRGSPFQNSQPAKRVKAISQEGDLIAVGEAVLPNLYHPMVVL